MELWRYYQVLRRRRWIVAAAVLAAVLTAVAANHPRPGDFFATATLSLPDVRRFDIVAGPLNPIGAQNQDQQVNQATNLIQSREVARRVVEALGLPMSAEELRARTSADRERFGPLVHVTVSGKTRGEAVRLTNAVADAAAGYDQEVRRREVTLGREFVEKQAQQAQADLMAAENTLLTFEKNNAVALNTPTAAQGAGSAQGSKTAGQVPGAMVIAGLQGELLGLDLSLQEIEAKLSAVRDQLKGQTSTRSEREITENPVTRQLRSQLVSLEVALTSELAVHTDKFPSVVTLRARIQAIKDRLKSELDKVVSAEQVKANPIYDVLNQNRVNLEVDKVALLAKREALQRAITANEQAVPRLAETQMEQARLARAVEIFGRRYMDLQGLVTQARLKEQEAQNLGSLSVVEYARSAEPSPLEGLRMKLTLAALLGLLGGVGLAFFLEYLDHSIGARENAERLLHVPALAAIPYHNPPFDDAYRLLRVNLAAGGEEPNGDVILVTGPRPGEGTSTVVTNLARAFARAGRRSIVVDAAFHRPAQHALFGVANETGLADVLGGNTALESALVPSEIPGLQVLPSGRAPKETDGLLGTKALADVIAGLRRHGDVILIDTAPAGTFTDAFSIAPHASRVLLVLDARRVPHGVEHIKEQFVRLGATVVGIALTKVRPDLVDSYVNQERFYRPRPRLIPSPAAAAAVGMLITVVRAGLPALRR